MKKLYLVVNHRHKPNHSTNKVKTHLKEWMFEPNAVHTDEVFDVVSNLSFNKLTEASVVIDLVNDKIIKNRFGDDEKVKLHYLELYSNRRR